MLTMILFLYFTIITVVSYAVMTIDKSRAKRNNRRIPEKTLFVLAWLGGSIGIWFGMKHFRHKTKKRSFTVGIPFVVITQIVVVTIIFLSI
ncbi:DUF1294 domain-containing protein [Bacillus sp. JCM 19034]|uniref:DUF1294 domain-containing protein n=1 Tax=Bacillus sp. JCM 19034 TaxID=1481928 RepID=UPI0007845784|nr:DUF1294 domain-containing protein [Bacillus sp. JCM 19034]